VEDKMSEPNFSSGDWKADIRWCNHGVVAGEGDKALRIASVLFSNDARLFAVAKEMYLKLSELRRIAEDDGIASWSSQWDEVDDLLAKARGESA
jgi:hypothetical protein